MFNSKWFSSDSSAEENKLIKSWAAEQEELQKQQEEERQRKEEEDRKRQEEANIKAGKNADGSEKSLLDRIGDVGKGIGDAVGNVAKTAGDAAKAVVENPVKAAGDAVNFIKDQAVDAVEKAGSTLDAAGKVISGELASGEQARRAEQTNDSRKELQEYVNGLSESDYDKPEVKAKIQQLNDKIESTKGTTAEQQKALDDVQKLDAGKVAADAAETFTNLATVGGAGAAAKAGQKATEELAEGAAKNIAKGLTKEIGTKSIGSRAAANAAEGAIYGAESGALDAAANGDGTTEDTTNRIVSQALAGGILGGGSSLGTDAVAAGVRRIRNKDGKTVTVDEAGNEVNLTPEQESKLDTDSQTGTPSQTSPEATESTISQNMNENPSHVNNAQNAAEEAVQAASEPTLRTPDEYRADLDRYDKGEFTVDDDVWKDRTVELNGRTYDLNQMDKEYAQHQQAALDAQKRVDEATNAGERAEAQIALETEQDILSSFDKTYQQAAEAGAPNREVDSQKVADNYRQLQSESRTANYDDYNANGRSVQEIQDELKQLDDDSTIPDNYRIALERAENLPAIRARFADNEGIVSQVDDLMTDRAHLANELDKYTTPEKADAEKARLDEQLIQKKEELAGVPEERREYELAKIREDYQAELRNIDDRLEADADTVQPLLDVQRELDNRESYILERAEALRQAEPHKYTDIDRDAVQARRDELNAELERARSYTEPNRIMAAEVSRPKAQYLEAVNNEPNAKQALVTELEDVVNNSTSLGKDIPMISYRSPSYVLEKVGLKPVFDDLASAYQRAATKTEADVKTIGNIIKEGNDSNVNWSEVVDYVEGKNTNVDAATANAGRQIQDFLNSKKEEMKAAGYDVIEDGYFPHQMIDDNKELTSMLSSDNKTKGEISFGSFIHRDANAKVDYSRDVSDVLMRYSNGFNRKIEMDPALKALDTARNHEAMNKATAQWVDDYMKQLKTGGKSTRFEENINNAIDKLYNSKGWRTSKIGTNHYRSATGNARMLTSIALMGGNIGSAVRNTTQMVNTTARYGLVNTTAGLARGVASLFNKGGKDYLEMKQAGVFNGTLSQSYKDDLASITGTMTKTGKVKDLNSKFGNIMMAGMSLTDNVLRSQAYMAAKMDGAAKGLKGKELVSYAAEGARKTQFDTSVLDTPTNMSSASFKTVSQLMTFTLKQTEAMAEYGIQTVKDPKTGKFTIKNTAKNINRFGQAVALGAGMTAVLGPLVGFKAEEFNPLNQQLGGDSADEMLYRSPVLKLLFGDGKSDSKGKAKNPGLIDVMMGKADMDKFMSSQWTSVVPGGAQLKKTIGGDELNKSGVSTSGSGKVQFSKGDSNELQNLVFGKYSSANGREWVNTGMKSLSGKQSEKVLDAPVNQRDKLVDYYRAVNQIEGRKEAVAKVRSLTKTSPGMARLEANKWNEKVDKELKQFYNEYGSIPQGLRDEFSKRVKITVSKNR